MNVEALGQWCTVVVVTYVMLKPYQWRSQKFYRARAK